jgi:hypothetical protein
MRARTRRLAVLLLPAALAATLASASWAAPGDPVPVKDEAGVTEGTPTSHGAWLGWTQSARRDAAHRDLYVERGSGAPVKVNAARTQGLGGGIVGHHVYYAQQFRDRHPRIVRFDLRTGHRSALPEVNRRRHSIVRGDVTASGPWLLYSGIVDDPDRDVYSYTVMLDNRRTHRVRTVAAYDGDAYGTWAGQVNGRYATYFWAGRYGGGGVLRYDIGTGRTVTLRNDAGGPYDPAVSSDGTVYYFLIPDDAPSGSHVYELVRQRARGAAHVVTTLTTDDAADGPGETYVRDRADGTHVVLFGWKGGVYKVVDQPPTAGTP